jgi:hypothetical protein
MWCPVYRSVNETVDVSTCETMQVQNNVAITATISDMKPGLAPVSTKRGQGQLLVPMMSSCFLWMPLWQETLRRELRSRV